MEASNGTKKTMEAFDAQKAYKVLERVNKFLGILIRENLVKDAPFIDEGELENESDLADDVWDVLQMKLRKCDVGTAEEQTERYRKFCSAHKYLGSDFSYMCKGFGKGRCPFFSSHTKSQCEFAWAQMPYEEGGAK